MNATTYNPVVLSDFIFANAESRDMVEDIVSGEMPFPFSGKTGILLYGTYGTGKTSLAKLLPNMIERGQTGDDLAMEADFFGCQQGHTGTAILERVNKQNSVMSLNTSA